MHYVTVYVGESEISAGEAIGELLMVESKAVKDRGVKVMVVNLVLNGSEIAGGSIRIHRPEIQQKVFDLIGFSAEDAESKFGFLLRALKFGAPPHGGIAFGLDRLIMHLAGTNNIRDVIAFPKTQSGGDLMIEAPSPISEAQLEELHVRTVIPVVSEP